MHNLEKNEINLLYMRQNTDGTFSRENTDIW